MKKRVSWIDIAKGICMISVILGHLGNQYLNVVYAFHLTTFFLLAGYTLKKKELTSDYLASKFKRLMIPYFATCICVTVMDIVNEIIVWKNVSTENITRILYQDILRCFFASGTYKNFGSIEVGGMIGAIWFLPAMFFALVFVQLILNKYTKWRTRFFIGICFAVLGTITAPFLWLPFSIQAGMLAVPFILFGMWMQEVELLEKIKTKHYILFAVIYLVGCLTGYAQVFYMVTCTMKDCIITPAISICACLLVIGISKRIGHSSVLEFIGENSVIFLCVHLFEMNTLSAWFTKFCSVMHLDDGLVIRTVIRMLFIFIVSYGIVLLLRKKKEVQNFFFGNVEIKVVASPKRDTEMDFIKAILIVLMLVGHRQINGDFRNVIYSFHMMAFVIISGYFYKSTSKELLGRKCKKLLKSLIPYGVFGIIYIIVRQDGCLTEVERLVFGISYTKSIFTDIVSIGPVYFLLLLFVVRAIYLFIDYFVQRELCKNLLIGACMLLGIFLGKIGFWLPWSIDCALFSLIFYHIGHYIKKYNIVHIFRERPYLYFGLSPLFAFMVYNGGMEIAVRRYSAIGVLVVGVVAAFLLLYMACEYMAHQIPKAIGKLVAWVGESTIYVLIIHTLFNGPISSWVASGLHLNPNNIFHCVVTIVIHLVFGVIVLGLAKGIRETRKIINYSPNP